MIEGFQQWLDTHAGSDWHWHVKRLSGNDTLATESHQAGPYLPKEQAFLLFPSLKPSLEPNPKAWLSGSIDSHGLPTPELAVTWYRAAKNECRITRWGGRGSPVLDPESTGSIAVFAFYKPTELDAEHVSVWVCSATDEELLTERVGSIEPGRPILLSSLAAEPAPLTPSSCELTTDSIPSSWLRQFPSGEEITRRCIEMRPCRSESVDDRLLLRRDCEYAMFRSIETMHVLPRIELGFKSVDEFIEYSHSINNRRKSRSGRSLELHVGGILLEEGVRFSHGEVSEGNKKPDFLFPSAADYRCGKPSWMLAAKTTCKDRWRQILNEADRIPRKHLLTLQEGVSVNQFNEMSQAGVTLVVPEALHEKYPKSVRSSLMSLATFISVVSADR